MASANIGTIRARTRRWRGGGGGFSGGEAVDRPAWQSGPFATRLRPNKDAGLAESRRRGLIVMRPARQLLRALLFPVCLLLGVSGEAGAQEHDTHAAVPADAAPVAMRTVRWS